MPLQNARKLEFALNTAAGAAPLMATAVASCMFGYAEYFKHVLATWDAGSITATPRQFARQSTYGALPVALATSAVTAWLVPKDSPWSDGPLYQGVLGHTLVCTGIASFPLGTMALGAMAGILGAAIGGSRGGDAFVGFGVGAMGGITLWGCAVAALVLCWCVSACLPDGNPKTWLRQRPERDLETTTGAAPSPRTRSSILLGDLAPATSPVAEDSEAATILARPMTTPPPAYLPRGVRPAAPVPRRAP